MHSTQYTTWVCFLLGVIYISYVWFILTLRLNSIFVFINTSVNSIPVSTLICLYNSYFLLLCCALYWEGCHAYFLDIICFVTAAVIVDLHPQKWINTSLFVTHIFPTNFSVFHIFISIFEFFCFSLVVWKLFNLNLQHSKTCNQHHVYTIFKKIDIFTCFILIYTRLQRVTLTTMESVLIFYM